MQDITDRDGEVCKEDDDGKYVEYPRANKWPSENEPAIGALITWQTQYGNESANYKKYYEGNTSSVPCRRRKAFGQPCDWRNQPLLLGEQVETLPVTIELDYPYVCTPGVLGGLEAANQTSSVCTRLCTPGKVCRGRPTLEEETCPAGFYCPLGSPVPLPCKPGTYSDEMGLSTPEQCTICPPVLARSSVLHSLHIPSQLSSPHTASVAPTLNPC